MSMTKPTSEQVTFLPAGVGAVDRTALDKMREMVSVKDFGAVGDDVTDDTAAFEAAATYSSATKKQILVPVGIYRIRGLDLKGKPACSFVGEYRRLTSGATLKTIGTANITSGGKTVFVRVNDGVVPGSTQPTTQLRNLFLLETGSSQRDIGLLAKGATWFTLSNVDIWGFDDGVVVGYLWNSFFDDLALVNFRTRGLVASDTNVNGLELRNLHLTSATTTPQCNVDLRGGNSINAYNVLTEGNCDAHFRVSAWNRQFNVYGLHLEGGKSIIEIPNESLPTQLYAHVAIYGGGMYPVGTATSADRFVKYSASASSIGLASLTLDSVSITKSSSCHSSYFDLGRVANFRSTATFEFNANASIDALTWTRIGEDINSSYGRSQTGHNGLVSSTQSRKFAVYGGAHNTFAIDFVTTGAALVGGVVIANIPLDGKTKIIEIDALIALVNSPNFARFVGGIGADGTTSVPSALVSQGANASATTFSYDPATGNLTATNSANFGFWTFVVRVTNF